MTQGDAPRLRRAADRLFGAPARPPAPRERPQRQQAPAAVRRAALVVAVEAALLAVGALVLAVLSVVGHPASVSAGLGAAVFVALVAAVLAAGARGLFRLSAWARGPVVALQLLLALLGYTIAAQAGRPLLGVPMIALAGAELYLLATPEARLAFFRVGGSD